MPVAYSVQSPMCGTVVAMRADSNHSRAPTNAKIATTIRAARDAGEASAHRGEGQRSAESPSSESVRPDQGWPGGQRSRSSAPE